MHFYRADQHLIIPKGLRYGESGTSRFSDLPEIRTGTRINYLNNTVSAVQCQMFFPFSSFYINSPFSSQAFRAERPFAQDPPEKHTKALHFVASATILCIFLQRSCTIRFYAVSTGFFRSSPARSPPPAPQKCFPPADDPCRNSGGTMHPPMAPPLGELSKTLGSLTERAPSPSAPRADTSPIGRGFPAAWERAAPFGTALGIHLSVLDL